MNVTLLRRVDRWLGVPLCFLLTMARRISDPFRPAVPERCRRILFVKLAEQGSTVLAHRAVCKAIERVGRENVFFLVFAENRFIMDALGLVPAEKVLTIPTTSPFSALRGALAAVRRLRRERVDAAVDFEFFSRASAILCYLSGAQRRVGFHAFSGEAAWRGDLMTHRLSYNPHLHTAQAFSVMVEALDANPAVLPALNLETPDQDLALPEWQPHRDEVRRLRERILEQIARQDLPPLVLLNANCSDLIPLRRWPAERYIELAQRLLARYPALYVLFTGTAAEAAETKRLVAAVQSQRCVSLAGQTTLRGLLALYCMSQVLVTNDSGPAHFATLTPLDVVTLFGPETPALYASRSPGTHVIWAEIPCSPCVNAYNDRISGCRNNICMQRISVDQVFREVCKILERRLGEGETRTVAG